MSKGYVSPKPFERGHCFICNKDCDKEAYCHYECAVAFSSNAKDKIKDAREQEKING